MLIYGMKPPVERAVVGNAERGQRAPGGVRNKGSDLLATRNGLSKSPRRRGRGRILSLRNLHHDVLSTT